MSNSKNANTKKSPPMPKYTVKNALINYYLVLMFTIFPLFFTNQYSNIRHDKYYLFLILSMIMAVVEFMMIISSAPSGNKLTRDKRFNSLTFTDYAMAALLLVYIISTLLSDYKSDAFTGNMGRNNGLLLMIAYVAVYFVITREYKFYEYVFAAFAVGSGLVYLLAVINYFYIDPLGMFKGYAERYVTDFSSTIGNKNLMASYVCVSLPVFMLLYMNTKNTRLKWLYYGISALGFCALLVADSDSGFLGFFVFLYILLVCCIRRPRMLAKYFFSLASMLFGAKLLRMFSLIMQDNSKGFTSIPSFFIYENCYSFILIALCAALAVGFYALCQQEPDLVFPKAAFFTALGVTALILAAAVYLFVKYTFIDTTSQLNELQSYFRFNDKWGTHRGYMWRKSAEIFANSGVKDKLFGCGPDTYYYVFSPYFSELSRLYGDSSTNCAHNEYLNYLITTGILGLSAYLCVIGGFIVRAVKYAKKNPYITACMAGVICYAVQSAVNIAQPITTPIFILLICIGEALCRQQAKT